ncbi:MAG: undecaprenyldiphospho-muramoylpentapeptide beta-N-acetylglucosaminyltransferase [Halioglobus sp.]
MSAQVTKVSESASGRRPMILMMAGGTGGHVYPALAVATELLARGYRVEWVGTKRGLESRVVPAAGILLHHLSVRGVRGKGVADKLLAIVSLGMASLQALWVVLRRAPGCVVGMGGYVAGPAGIAAWLLRKPLLIHEQNAVAGTTNRMLAPFATRIVTGFAHAFDKASDGKSVKAVKTVVLGNPVRRELLLARENYVYDYAGQRPLRLLVVGGSLGAQAINETVAEFVTENGTENVELFHQTGTAHYQSVLDSYGPDVPSNVRIAAFIEDMQAAYAWADVVLCRAGALTVAELAVMGRPAILVPLPSAIDDHQSANAAALTDVGAALLVSQELLCAKGLAQTLAGWIAQPDALRAMARASFASATPDAAQRVSDLCEELLHA